MKIRSASSPSIQWKAIADELRRRYAEFSEVPDSILNFMEAHRR
jgi:hypothetical protein